MREYLKSKLFVTGLLLVLLGSAPLVTIIVLADLGLWPDPDPNPVGPGILHFLTFWPGLVCTIAGGVQVRRQRRDNTMKQSTLKP